jgi:glycosyltransferase involved in cell wall biosynthesis
VDSLSIVTINYNNRLGLRRTFESIKGQTTKSFQYIVVDGDSRDGSKEVIREYSDIIDRCVIEKDSGIAEAFNKGIERATGERLLFLNSGDTLVDGSVGARIINDYATHDIAFCLVEYGENKASGYVLAGRRVGLWRQVFRNYLAHQGMLIRRELFDRFGRYDERFRLGMDYEWSLRLLKNRRGLRLKWVDAPITRMDPGGTSVANYRETFMSYHRARIKQKTLSRTLSLSISLFFIVKRWFGNTLRSLNLRI